MNDFFKKIQGAIQGLKQSFNSNLNDDKGLFQRGQFTPIKNVQQSIQNWAQSNPQQANNIIRASQIPQMVSTKITPYVNQFKTNVQNDIHNIQLGRVPVYKPGNVLTPVVNYAMDKKIIPSKLYTSNSYDKSGKLTKTTERGVDLQKSILDPATNMILSTFGPSAKMAADMYHTTPLELLKAESKAVQDKLSSINPALGQMYDMGGWMVPPVASYRIAEMAANAPGQISAIQNDPNLSDQQKAINITTQEVLPLLTLKFAPKLIEKLIPTPVMKAIYTNVGPVLIKSPALINLLARAAARGSSSLFLISIANAFKQGTEQNIPVEKVVEGILKSAPNILLTGSVLGAGGEAVNIGMGNTPYNSAYNFNKQRIDVYNAIKSAMTPKLAGGVEGTPVLPQNGTVAPITSVAPTESTISASTVNQVPEIGTTLPAISNDNLAFRQTTPGSLNLTVDQAQKELGKLFTPEEIKFITVAPGSIVTPEGKVAEGSYGDSLIKVVENKGLVEDKTLYHEAFHAYTDKFADPTLYKDAKAEAISQYGLKDEAAASERLAEDFANWNAGRQTFTGKILAFFQDLFTKLKSLFGRVNNSSDLFRAVVNRERPSTAPLSDRLTSYEVTPGANMGGITEPQLTSKVISRIGNRGMVSRHFVEALINQKDIKLPEKEIVTKILAEMPGDKIDGQMVVNRIKQALMPLGAETTNKWADYNGEWIDNFRPSGTESISRVYQAPFETKVGNTHFEDPKYFGHTRIEDLPDGKTRRIIELQSDLFQGGNYKELIDSSSEMKRRLTTAEINTKDMVEQVKLLNDAKKAVADGALSYYQNLKDTTNDYNSVIWDKVYKKYNLDITNPLKRVTDDLMQKGPLEVTVPNALNLRIDMRQADLNTYSKRAEELKNQISTFDQVNEEVKTAKKAYIQDLEIQKAFAKATASWEKIYKNIEANKDIVSIDALKKETASAWRDMTDNNMNVAVDLEQMVQIAKDKQDLLRQIQEKINSRNNTLSAYEKDLATKKATYDYVSRPEYKDEFEKKKQMILAYRNNWPERMIREEINKAAIDGKSVVKLPTGDTVAQIEGYLSNGMSVPSNAVEGDSVEVGGETYYVISDYGDSADVVPKSKFGGSYNYRDYITDEETYQSENIADDPFAFRDEIIKYLKENKKTTQANELTSMLALDPEQFTSTFEKEGIDAYIQDIAAKHVEAYMFDADSVASYMNDMGDGYIYKSIGNEDIIKYEENAVESFTKGPSIDTEDVRSELSDEQKNVYDFYEKDVPKLLNKIKPDFKTETDENGLTWYQLNITPDDVNNVYAFRIKEDKKLAKESPGAIEYSSPYSRGDIQKIQARIDHLMGTDQYVFSDKWQAKEQGRITAREALVEAAKTLPDAAKALKEILKLENSIVQARKDNGNNLGIQIGDRFNFDSKDWTVESVLTMQNEDKFKMVDSEGRELWVNKMLLDGATPIAAGTTQAEAVKGAVKESAKSIKAIAKETGILEPNVRRILGVGAKEGIFTRVDKGVYVLSNNGQDTAWIQAANSVEALPKLVSDGFKADQIFLDIPYITSGVTGGNRGMKFEGLTLKDWKNTIVPNAISLLRTEDSPLVYMYSNSKTGWKQMVAYNQALIDAGLQIVAKGTYSKTYKSGEPMKFGKYPMPPEGILIFNQSGNPVNMPASFDIQAVAPLYKGHYQTEKAPELLKAIIKGTTKVGDMILDPFAGSGVTGAEAVKLGRKATLIEKDPEVVKNVTVPRVEAAINETKDTPPPVTNTDVANPTDPFYNLDHMNIAPEDKLVIKKTVEDIKDELKATKGARVTHEEVLEAAKTATDDIIQTIGREETLKWEAAQEKLKQKIASMAETGTVDKSFIDAIKAHLSFGTNTARLLEARSIDNSVNLGGPVTPEAEIKILIIKKLLALDKDEKMILEASKNVDWGNKQSVATFYRQFVKPTLGEFTDKLRYSSMLSSPITHIINTSSNFQGAEILYPIQKTIEGTLDALATTMSGGTRQRTRFAGEGIEYLKGTLQKEVLQNAVRVLKDTFADLSINPQTGMRNLPMYPQPGILHNIEKAMDVTTNALGGMDNAAREIITGGLGRAYKYRANKGVKVNNINKVITDEATHILFQDPLDIKGDGMINSFIGHLAMWVQELGRSKNQLVSTLGRYSFPFVKIGTNLAKAGIASNPVLGSVNLIGNEDKIRGMAQLITGSLITLLTIALLNAKKIRIHAWEPADKTKRDAQREANIQPWSIDVPTLSGEKNIQFSKMHPTIAFQMGMVAAVYQAVDENKISGETGAVILGAMFGTGRFIADQTVFKNLSDFASMLNGDEYAISSLIANYPKQLVPFRAFQGWFAKIVDEYQRVPNKDVNWLQQTLQSIQSGIPWASKGVPTRKDTYGQPLKHPNRFFNLISPFKTTTIDQNKKVTLDLLNERADLNKLKAKQKADAAKLSGEDIEVSPEVGSQKEQDRQRELREEIVRSEVATSHIPQAINGKYFYWNEDTGTVIKLDSNVDSKITDGLSDASKAMMQRTAEYKYMNKLAQGAGIDPAYIEQESKRLGITLEDSLYDVKTGLTDDLQLEEIKNGISGMNYDDMLATLISYRKVSEGTRTALLTDALINKLNKAGILDDDTAAFLKTVEWNDKTQSYQKSAGGGSSSKSKAPPKFSLPAVKATSLKVPSFKSGGNAFTMKRYQPTAIKIPKMPKQKAAPKLKLKKVNISSPRIGTSLRSL